MAQNEIWTIGKILKWTEQYFASKGIESPRLDAEVLLSHVLKKERIYLYVHFDAPLEPSELAAYKYCIKKRLEHMPVAYITGTREFMGLDFHVTTSVLIPRPDTEILVQTAMDHLKDMEHGESPVIADIGTGSGAICLSMLSYMPELQAVTVDISEDAIQVAKGNAESLNVADRIEFIEGDMLEPLAGQSFDAIVSNPPYIPERDIEGLEPEVKCYEPMGALVADDEGMIFYKRLLQDAPKLLKTGGFLALEAGIHEAGPIKDIGESSGDWENIEVIKDLAGIDRVVVLRKRG